MTGCTGDNADLHAHINRVSKRPGRPIEPIPDYKPMPKFSFPSNIKRRDPFFAFRKVVKKTVTVDLNAPNIGRKKEILETFPLDSLSMVGILKQGGAYWGLVKGPSGKIYKVTIGNHMGKDHGRVVRVTDKYIRLIETVKEGKKWKKKSVKLELQKNKFKLNKVADTLRREPLR